MQKTSDDADESIYKMNGFGKFVIISLETFLPYNNKTPKHRIGAKKDAKLLETCFSNRRFHIVGPYFKRTKEDIGNIVENLTGEESVFGLFLGTHGGRRGSIRATDKEMNIRDIILPICKKLPKEIPKIFFIQACRGGQGMPTHEESKGNKENDAEENEEKDAEENEEKDADIKLPPHVLLVRSTVEEYFSFRNSEGSWMVQDITKAFGNYPSKEVITIITRANDALSDRRSTYDPKKKEKEEKEPKEKEHKKKEHKKSCQVMSITSTLQKDLFLLPSEQ